MWNNRKISVLCGSEILFVNQNYATFSLHVQSLVTYPFFYQLLLACDFPSWMAILRFWLWVQWTNTLFDKLKHIQAQFESLKWKSGNFPKFGPMKIHDCGVCFYSEVYYNGKDIEEHNFSLSVTAHIDWKSEI